MGRDDGRDDVPVGRTDGHLVDPVGRRAPDAVPAHRRDRAVPRRLHNFVGRLPRPRLRRSDRCPTRRRRLFEWGEVGRGRDLRGRGDLPADAAQDRVFTSLPIADRVAVPLRELPRAASRCPGGRPSRPVLRGVLLGFDDRVGRGGCHERAGDDRACRRDLGREGLAIRRTLLDRGWHRAARYGGARAVHNLVAAGVATGADADDVTIYSPCSPSAATPRMGVGPAGDAARMPPPSQPSPPFQSLTTPPPSWTRSPPAATSHGASPSSKNPSNTPHAVHARSNDAAPGRRRSSNASSAADIDRRYRASRSLRRNGNPVATTADAGGRELTRQGAAAAPGRSQTQPPSAAACHTSSRNGAATAPATGRSSSTNATDTPTAQNPWT